MRVVIPTVITHTESEVVLVAVVDLHGEVVGFRCRQLALLVQQVKDAPPLHLYQL